MQHTKTGHEWSMPPDHSPPPPPARRSGPAPRPPPVRTSQRGTEGRAVPPTAAGVTTPTVAARAETCRDINGRGEIYRTVKRKVNWGWGEKIGPVALKIGKKTWFLWYKRVINRKTINCNATLQF